MFRLSTSASAAVLYRLNGDLNPLHIDPVAAADGGFARPILHGLCTFGYAGYALARLTGRGGLSDFGAIAARFSAPAFPGEPLEVQMWRDGDDIRFRCLATERGVVVLGNGVAMVREALVAP